MWRSVIELSARVAPVESANRHPFVVWTADDGHGTDQTSRFVRRSFNSCVQVARALAEDDGKDALHMEESEQ